MIAVSLEGTEHNKAFQSKRIKDALRMLIDMGIKFVQEEN
jgi:hypothetical protein